MKPTSYRPPEPYCIVIVSLKAARDPTGNAGTDQASAFRAGAMHTQIEALLAPAALQDAAGIKSVIKVVAGEGLEPPTRGL